jgi:toxin ParE1/3/4
MPSYETAPEVDDDLRGIVSYTAERWGVKQVRKYMAGLERQMARVASGEAHTKPLGHVLDGLKVGRYERHYIFAVERSDAPLLILAVFHEKMSVIDRLKKRF